jgi:glucose-1-phosphate cytidylyltransferase
MKVVILAGGFGTRLAEETGVRPKPMVEVGGRPLLWHIMKHYAHHGFREFLIALGYKGEMVKQYFLDYHNLSGSMTISLGAGKVTPHGRACEDWEVHLMDTGTATNTGGRLEAPGADDLGRDLHADVGDGVSDVDLPALLRFHRAAGASPR